MAKRKRRSGPEAPDRADQISYVESSALVASLLESDVHVRAELSSASRLVTSSLTRAETMRAIRRARVAGRLNPDEERKVVRSLGALIRRCFIVQMDEAVLGRVGRPFPVEPIRTLDAIHVATAERLGEPPQLVTIVSRHERVRANAAAMGYVVRPEDRG